MKAVFLVPRRADNGHRDALWAIARARWEALFPDVAIVEGHHEHGPFNRSKAINDAAAEAGDWDVAVIIDSDVILPTENVRAAIKAAHKTGKVTWAHRRWRGLSQRATAALMSDPAVLLQAGYLPDEQQIERTNEISWSCCIAVRRDAWDELRGFDERFRGWGWEDMAFQSAAVGLIGHKRIEGDVYHLWHPRSPGLGRAANDADSIRSARLGRRYMVALRRDHGMNDRSDLSDVSDIDRDIANLRRDDMRMERKAARLGLPDWSNWWPTLEELRDPEAKRDLRFALVVHSGGDAGNWDQRSLYLDDSLGSLDQLVPHEWTQKVVFTDWGDEMKPAVDDIASSHGYDVAGPKARLGYTRSMQRMWRYINGLDVDYVFVTEDDFTIDREVDVSLMAEVMEHQPHLVQMALLRGAFYEPEREPGTILGHPEAAFEKRANGSGTAWLEHSRFFTANPMLIRRSLARIPWPSSRHSEAVYGRQLFRRDRHARAAFWGHGEPWITHIGETRAGGSY